MANIRHILTTGTQTEIDRTRAVQMIKACGVASVREWRDQLAGKLVNFVSIVLDHGCGTVEVGYASRATARAVANAIMEGN